MNPIILKTWLAFAGALPFMIGALCLASGISTLPVLGSVDTILSTYALVILSFMAGSHWGQHLEMAGIWSIRLPLLSNAVALLGWIGFLVLPFKPLAVLFSAVFLVLLLIDRSLFRQDLIDAGYYRIRKWVTAVVVLALLCSGILA